MDEVEFKVGIENGWYGGEVWCVDNVGDCEFFDGEDEDDDECG